MVGVSGFCCVLGVCCSALPASDIVLLSVAFVCQGLVLKHYKIYMCCCDTCLLHVLGNSSVCAGLCACTLFGWEWECMETDYTVASLQLQQYVL